MQLTEQHVISRDDPRYKTIDDSAFKSKNLYNAALYVIRQAYIHEGKYLDRDEMPVYDPNQTEKPKFSGKRIKRGLYRAADGTLINADCNGSGNIIRKVAPDAWKLAEDVEDGKGHQPVVHPVRLSFPSRSQKASNGGSKRSIEREIAL